MPAIDYPSPSWKNRAIDPGEAGPGEAECSSSIGTINVEFVSAPAAAAVAVDCLHSPYGAYHVAGAESGKIRHRRADLYLPPYTLSGFATAGTADATPALAVEPGNRLWLLWYDGTTAKQSYSDDDGETWSTPTVAIAGGKHPRIVVSRDGMILRAAYVSGAIKMTRQEPGEAAAGAEFTVQKTTSGVLSNLAVSDAAFGLSFAPDNPGRLLLHYLPSGSTTTADAYSTDDGSTFTVVT